MNQKELMLIIKKAAENLATELEISFPGLSKLTYSEHSIGSYAGADFVNRMVFGIYLELIKADLLNDIKPA